MPTYRTNRHVSITPSLPSPSSGSSVRSAASQSATHSNSSPSQIYSESRNLSEEPSYLSSDNGTSSEAELDSLADADDETVEQRALSLLALQDEGLLFGGSGAGGGNQANESTAGGVVGAVGTPTANFTAKDVPRKQAVPVEGAPEAKEGMENAVAFLRRCILEAESSDFKYKTPSVFGAPMRLDPRKGAEGEGNLMMENEEGTAWLDAAFNIESYGNGTSSSGASEASSAGGAGGFEDGYNTFFDETEGATGGLAYMDLEPGGVGGGAGMPFLRDGEEEMVGGGFGLGGGGGGGRGRRRAYQ